MTVAITAGSLYIVPNALAPTPAQIVGGSDQWSDNSDATYGESTNTFVGGTTGTQGEAVAAPLTMTGSGSVQTFAVTARAMLTTDDTSPPSTLGVEIHDAADNEIVFIRWSVPSVGVIYDLADPDMIYAGSNSLSTLLMAIQNGGAYVVSVGNPPATQGRYRALTIYELDFIVTSVSNAPSLRRYPRSDGLGVGPTRHYPPPQSRRLAGGIR